MAQTNKQLARVLWFDQKKGYGFIRLMNESKDELFFHFSEIQSEGTYKKVYPSEYIHCDVCHDEEKDKDVAKNITGVNDELLMIDHEDTTFKYYNKNN